MFPLRVNQRMAGKYNDARWDDQGQPTIDLGKRVTHHRREAGGSLAVAAIDSRFANGV